MINIKNKIVELIDNIKYNEAREFHVGDEVVFKKGRYYYSSNGSLPYGFKYKNKNVFVTKVNMAGTHPYHISVGNMLGDNDLGWVKADCIESV